MTDEDVRKATDPNRERRRVEVHRGGEWVTTTMRELVVGDRFRMFESDGDPVEDGAQFHVDAEPRERDDVPGRFSVVCTVIDKLPEATS